MSKITELEISKFQRISYAKIEPTGNMIVLAGKNAQGKTSALDAIEANICGHNGRNITRPILDGAGKATIETRLDNGYTMIRKYTPSGTTLTAKDADGSKLGQADLNKMIGALGIDASRFATIGEKEQLKTLLSVVDLPFNPAELEAERKRIFDERTAVSRDEKNLAAQLKSYPAAVAGLPETEVSVAGLLSEYRDAEKAARRQQDDHDDLAIVESKVSTCNADILEVLQEIERLKREVERLEGKRDGFKADVAATEKVIANHPTLPDFAAIQEQINGAEETNAAVRAEQTRRAVENNLAVTRTEADALTAQLEAIDNRKVDGLAAAADKMPVEGLTFDDEGVLYQGVPFSRASSAEQLIVSVAMIIATDPDLRTAVVRNGNDLDADSLAILEEMATDNDFQVFIEIVSDDTDHEYTFVEGEISA